MKRDLATVLDIIKDAIYWRALNITPEGQNLHRKRKRDATEGYESADENEKKQTVIQNLSTHINTSFLLY